MNFVCIVFELGDKNRILLFIHVNNFISVEGA